MIYEIGSGGLKAINTNVLIQENTPYYLGASSSPKRIFVTRVVGDDFYYLNSPYNGRELRGDNIYRSLIRKGTARQVANNKAYMGRYLGSDSDLYKEFKAATDGFEKLLAGKPAPELVEDPEGLKYGFAVLSAGEGPHPRGDAWYSAEHYGGVSGLEVDGVDHYRVRTQVKCLEDIKADKSLVFVSFELEPASSEY